MIQALIELWEADSLRATTAPPRPFDKSAAFCAAAKLIEDGCLSKAMSYLSTLGLDDLEFGPIKAQLQRKHPQHGRGWVVDLRDAPRVRLGSPAAVLKNLRRRAGTSVGGGGSEYLIRLVRGMVAASVRE